MSDNARYTVVAVDGEATEIGDFSTQSLRYDRLTWEESLSLAKLSFSQGFEVIIWRIDDGNGAKGGGGECGET